MCFISGKQIITQLLVFVFSFRISFRFCTFICVHSHIPIDRLAPDSSSSVITVGSSSISGTCFINVLIGIQQVIIKCFIGSPGIRIGILRYNLVIRGIWLCLFILIARGHTKDTGHETNCRENILFHHNFYFIISI